MLKLVFLLFVQASLAVVPFDPQGPHKVKSYDEGNLVIHPDGAGMGVAVWTPIEKGEYPVLVFATGFGGDAPSIAYGNVLSHIASYGYIVVSIDQLKYPQPNKYVKTMVTAIDWIEVNLSGILAKHFHKDVTYNFNNMALSAQSSGNHMTVSYLNFTCGKAKALIMIDPVDGADPFGIVKNFIITPGESVHFQIPALMLDNGKDPQRTKIGPACAPEELSNDRFYNAWNAPIWNINATEYGHVDCLDAALADVAKFLCPGHGGVLKPYQELLGGLSVGFLDAVFRGRTDYVDLLENSAALPVTNIVKHDYHGMARAITPYCIHS